MCYEQILGWPKSLFRFFYKMVWKKKNDSMEKSKGTFFANPIFSILGNVATQCLAIGNSIQG